MPLSYRDPSGPAIQLALGRLPAADQEHKLGTIFFDPGGPGGSGRIPPELTPELHERFDIVGFDPRGIGSSTPLRCFRTPEEGEALLNVARDMDLLRQAVGEQKLSYYGLSYGTHLGSVYANLFPERAGAMALDSALDPVEWTTGDKPGSFDPISYRVGGHDGAQQALRKFLDVCAFDERCAFREPGTNLLAKYNTVLDRLLAKPVTITEPGGAPVEITYQVAVERTREALYSATEAPQLAETLQTLYEVSDSPAPQRSTPVVDLPEPAPRPGYQQAGYSGREQYSAVLCTDSSNPGNPSVWSRYAREADRHARGFGSAWTYLSLSCATWPGVDPDRYTGPWNGETANPVLVLGNRQGDPATPYDDSQRLAKMLGNARLLTLDTFGHGALMSGKPEHNSACVSTAVNHYFTNGELPDPGTVCQPDRGPFDPPA